LSAGRRQCRRSGWCRGGRVERMREAMAEFKAAVGGAALHHVERWLYRAVVLAERGRVWALRRKRRLLDVAYREG